MQMVNTSLFTHGDVDETGNEKKIRREDHTGQRWISSETIEDLLGRQWLKGKVFLSTLVFHQRFDNHLRKVIGDMHIIRIPKVK